MNLVGGLKRESRECTVNLEEGIGADVTFKDIHRNILSFDMKAKLLSSCKTISTTISTNENESSPIKRKEERIMGIGWNWRESCQSKPCHLGNSVMIIY